MKNTFLFLIAAAILIYGAWWQYQLVQNFQPVEPITAPAPSQAPQTDPKPVSEAIPEQHSSTDSPPPYDAQADIDEQQLITEETQEALGLASELNPPPLWTSTFPQNNNITPLSFNRETLLRLQEGDTLPLPQINGQQWNATVTQRSLSSLGNLTLEATLTAWSENYPVIITQGKKHTFATISTPDGVYELEAKGSEGTLRPSSTFNQLINSDHSDILPAPST